MGSCCCVNKQEINEKINKDVEKEIAAAKLEDQKMIIKLVMLGTGYSGKSTIFKQMQFIHGNGYTQSEQIHYRQKIHLEIIDSFKILIQSCQEYYDDDPNIYPKLNLHGSTNYNNDIQAGINGIENIPGDFRFKGDIVEHLRILWNYNPIQEMFKLRNEICIPDSLEYFMNKLDEVSKDDYIPTDQDILLLNNRTTGMQDKKYHYKSHEIQICDTGGQKNERKKWMNFFENVSAIIFVVNIACYDEIIFESETNGMVDSLACFNEQINSEYFTETPFILIFNKIDVFKQKIKKVPITVAPCFEHFNGNPNDCKTVKEMIVQAFKDQRKNSNPEIHVQFVNATDKSAVESLFNNIYSFVTNAQLVNK